VAFTKVLAMYQMKYIYLNSPPPSLSFILLTPILEIQILLLLALLWILIYVAYAVSHFVHMVVYMCYTYLC
jgi:hypothetical protein